ncbi:MAG: hypothetical protein ACK4NF_01635, partial [Planctomycetota bacterium]
MEISIFQLAGIWVATFLTFAILSFLYKENPLFKIAESLFVGTSYGYSIVVVYFQYLKPKFFEPMGRLLKSLFSSHVQLEKGDSWIILIPTLLGILLLMQMFPRYSWLARYTFAFAFGVGTGMSVVPTITELLFKQTEVTMQPIVIGNTFNINGIIILIGVLSVLAYFFFSFERKGIWKNLSTLGLYFLLISFGAAYGFTVMARETLLIGRIEFLLDKSMSKKYFFPALLIVIFIIYFVISSTRSTPE